MADNQDEIIQSFIGITGADAQAARHYLEASNWNLPTATEQFYDNDEAMGDAAQLGGDDEELYTAPEQPSSSSSAAPAASSSSSSKKSSSKPKSRFATLGDLKKSAASDDDESEDEKQDMFAGGEKSGLAVQNPDDENRRGAGGPNLIQDILKRAAEGARSRSEDEESTPAPRFTGTGHTLGSEDAPSVEIPDANAARPAPRQSVTRTLTFWRDGFSVEDGPLMRYDDPANEEILRAIENGRAPLSLMNVEPGQPADVNVFKRLNEDYVAPKKKFVPFSGSGNRLGSVTPGETVGSSSAAPTAVSPAPAASAPAAPTVDIDASAPTTTLQIRLGDGTRLVSRFNHTHTVQDLYGFVNASSVASRSRDYVLQTTFPNNEFKDMGQTLKDAGLINAVVVQKWA